MAKKKTPRRVRMAARAVAMKPPARKAAEPSPTTAVAPPALTDREIAEFKALLQTTAAASAQGISITNSNIVDVTAIAYSVDNKTWQAVDQNPTVKAKATRVFDLRTQLGSAAQGPIYIRYRIGVKIRVIGTGWYYSYTAPPQCKACYLLAKVDAGPTYDPW